MSVATSLIPELDQIVRIGDPKRRGEAARAVADLFLTHASVLRSAQVALFDGVLIDLVRHAELGLRIDLAERLCRIANAPPGLIGQLAREDEIMVAGPILRLSSVLDEPSLVEIALIQGQGHLLAMAERPTISPDLTNIIVQRGDRDVIRRVAGNAGALFSQASYSELIRRAAQDGVLTIKLGQRDDLPRPLLQDLLAGSIDPVRRRLFQIVKPGRQVEIKQAMAAISGVAEQVRIGRDFEPAQRTVLKLSRDGYLNEGALLGFAKAQKYEETLAALSAMSGVHVLTLDHLMSGHHDDPILIIGKAIGLDWPTLRALMLLRMGPNRVPADADLERARTNFSHLMPSTAERVVNFWKTRGPF